MALPGVVLRYLGRGPEGNRRRITMNEESLFHLAREKPPGERAAFLEEACAGDTALRQRLEVLLQAHDAPGSLLQRPTLTCAAGPRAAHRASFAPLFLPPTEKGRDPIHLGQLQPLAAVLDWRQQRRL